MADSIEEKLDKHEEEDNKRFSLLDKRLSGLEKKVALGSFLGVVAAQLVERGVLSIPQVLQVLAQGQASILAFLGWA